MVAIELDKPVKLHLIFIVGVGRSGTSLIQSMFAAHPRIACLPETSFVRRYVTKGRLEALFKTEGKAAVVKTLDDDSLFARIRCNASGLTEKALSHEGILDSNIYRQLVVSVASEKGVSWVGDKDPRLIEFLPILSKVFPDVRVINIIRDPRDVLASKKKADWSRNGHVWRHIFANRVQLMLGKSCGPDLLGKNYHEIIYEDLIASPSEVLTDLCKEIGLPFDIAMLSFGEAAQKLVSKSEVQWKKETFGPLLQKNKGKWIDALQPKEILLTEACCSESMATGKYRYDERRYNLSLADKLWLVVGNVIIKIATWPYIHYRRIKQFMYRI